MSAAPVVTQRRVLICGSAEDLPAVDQIERAMHTWGVPHDRFVPTLDAPAPDATDRAAIEGSAVFVRVCTPTAQRSVGVRAAMDLFRSLQSDAKRRADGERRTLVNLILDPRYAPEPFDLATIFIDATVLPQKEWMDQLHRAVTAPSETEASVGIVAVRRRRQSGLRRQRAGLVAVALALLLALGLGVRGWAASQPRVPRVPSATPTFTPVLQEIAYLRVRFGVPWDWDALFDDRHLSMHSVVGDPALQVTLTLGLASDGNVDGSPYTTHQLVTTFAGQYTDLSGMTMLTDAPTTMTVARQAWDRQDYVGRANIEVGGQHVVVLATQHGPLKYVLILVGPGSTWDDALKGADAVLQTIAFV
jgi:hypothetical protein